MIATWMAKHVLFFLPIAPHRVNNEFVDEVSVEAHPFFLEAQNFRRAWLPSFPAFERKKIGIFFSSPFPPFPFHLIFRGGSKLPVRNGPFFFLLPLFM